MVLRTVVTVLAGVGFYVSLFMLAKARRAAKGEVRGPSVVKTPQSHLLGAPNSLLGCLYYVFVAVAIWFTGTLPAAEALALVALLAATTSIVLAYSLLFITKRWCPYCWTAHVMNWAIAILAVWHAQRIVFGG
jgi:uncharacterized membrane protein